MANERTVASFDELIRRGVLTIGDGYRAKLDELGGDGPIFLRAGHVSDTHIDFQDVERFQKHLAHKVASKMSEVGDVVVTTKGNSTGRVAFVGKSMPQFVYSPHLSYWRSTDHRALFPGYLRYWSRSEEFRRQLRGLSTSTDMAPYLSLVDQRRLKITLPDPQEQRSIAATLGTLDDKIEVNRRMGETLEAIARAIFKSWFVDFSPVRAKASGEPTESICRRLGLTPDLLALFPDRLDDSELGEIPEGWRPGTIADYCYLNAQSWTEKTLPAEIHYVDLANAKNGVISQVQVFSACNAPSRARRVLRAGDTIVGTVRPGNRSFALISKGAPQLTGSTGFAALSPKRNEFRELVYLLATSEENIARLSHLADGAAYPAVRPDVVTAGASVIPPPAVIDEFHGVVSAIIDRQIANQASDTRLAAIRDALLPKLVSGELRVPLEGDA